MFSKFLFCILFLSVFLFIGLPFRASAQLPCTLKSQGDADCNNRIDLSDFEQWRKEFMGLLTSTTADFNDSGAADLADFEIWRKEYFADF